MAMKSLISVYLEIKIQSRYYSFNKTKWIPCNKRCLCSFVLCLCLYRFMWFTSLDGRVVCRSSIFWCIHGIWLVDKPYTDTRPSIIRSIILCYKTNGTGHHSTSSVRRVYSNWYSHMVLLCGLGSEVKQQSRQCINTICIGHSRISCSIGETGFSNCYFF